MGRGQRDQRDQRTRRRRWMVAGTAALAAIGIGAAAAGADGALTITPSSGAPGTSYAVEVTCGVLPMIKRHNTQDAYVQMTIAPYGPDDVTEVSPSVWRVDATAGATDDEYWAECDGAAAGSGRFDAESPHLWFGPRVDHTPYQLVGKTTVEGTDCPAGTEATVTIHADGDILLTETAAIDSYGDWAVALPQPVGDATYRIEASCGAVAYAPITATTTSTSAPVPPPATTPPTTPTTAPTAAPASAQPGTAAYTG